MTSKTTSSPLQESVQHLVTAATDKAVSSLSHRVLDATGRLTDYAEHGGGSILSAVTGSDKKASDEKAGPSPVVAALGAGVSAVGKRVKEKATGLKDAITGGGAKGKGKGKKLKIANIVESIDVGVPVQVAYDQWTQFEEFPRFTKKLDQVEQVSDEKLRWKAQVFWSHRTWESTILEQVPDQRIVWRSKGGKGYVDGAVTFHELTPDLTRILVVLEYHPHGLFEKTGNIWRAQGRRMRLELKHFQRHVMTQSILHQDEIEGWPGEIRDGQVVEQDEDGVEEDEQDDYDEEPEAESDEAEEPDREESDDVDDAEEPESRPRARARKRAGANTTRSRTKQEAQS